MKRLLQLGFIVVLTALSTVAYSQNLQFSLQAGSNLSIIQSQEYDSEVIRMVSNGSGGFVGIIDSGIYIESFCSRLGGSVKGNLDINLRNGFYTRIGLGVSLIRFKKDAKFKSNSNIDILGSNVNMNDSSYVIKPAPRFLINSWENNILVDNQTSLVYFDIPVMLGYSFFNNKLDVRLGGTASVLAYSETLKPYSITKDTSSDGLSNMMLSGNAEISYKVWNNFAVTASNIRQFNNIYDEISTAKNQNVSLGVEYRFSPKIAPNTSL